MSVLSAVKVWMYLQISYISGRNDATCRIMEWFRTFFWLQKTDR